LRCRPVSQHLDALDSSGWNAIQIRNYRAKTR
jgi:hypothetical protein